MSHEANVKRTGLYLKDTRKGGTIFKPEKSKGTEYYIDAEFSGGLQSEDPQYPA